MPKLVDPKQRRAELAEAVWTVIRRDGLQRASVRDYAEQVALIPHLVHLLPPSSTRPGLYGRFSPLHSESFALALALPAVTGR